LINPSKTRENYINIIYSHMRMHNKYRREKKSKAIYHQIKNKKRFFDLEGAFF
jgi:hypothetical protein